MMETVDLSKRMFAQVVVPGLSAPYAADLLVATLPFGNKIMSISSADAEGNVVVTVAMEGQIR